MLIFYARCSTEEQNEARQTELAHQLGAEKIFLDKVSGSTADRPKLREMLGYIREGDVVCCSEISRIARNTGDLLRLVELMKSKDVEFKSNREKIDTTTPQGKFMLTVFGAMAELERDCIRQRQAEGIEAAKKAGKYKGRRMIKLDEKKFRESCKSWRRGEITAAGVARKFGISPNTFYRRVRDMGL